MGIIVRDACEADVAGITLIHNDAVARTTAIWDEEPVDTANRAAWLAGRRAAGYPVLVAADGGVCGFASFGPFRAYSGFRHTVEHSVYVSPDRQGGGIGTALLRALIERARASDRHAMIAGIESGNRASIGLHERLGFERVGLLREVGSKFGRWLDLAFLQLVLAPRAGASDRR